MAVLSRQPELRGPGPSAGARVLPRVAAAVRGLRARRPHRPRPHDRADRRGRRRARSSCATSGRAPTRCARRWRRRSPRSSSRPSTGASGTATITGATCRRRPVPSTTGTRPRPTSGSRRSSRTSARRGPIGDIEGARVLVKVGDSITTDHISPAGSIKADSPAGQLPARARRRARGLQLLRRAARQPRGDDARHVREHPPAQRDGARHRGVVHDPPVRAARSRASTTRPSATAPRARRSPCSPARSTAAARAATGRRRVPTCSGVRFVIAESYERIHRSNLVGMGVLPLQYASGRVRGLARPRRARETFAVRGLDARHHAGADRRRSRRSPTTAP